MRLFKQLVVLALVAFAIFGTLALFSMDVIKIEWVTFMEVQPSFDAQEEPLPVPAFSIPVDGPAFIPNMGAPENPVVADEISISRGKTLFELNCVMCHGATAEGNGPVSALLANKPANLTSIITQSKSDGALFLTLTNGVDGRMPPMVENLNVRDRWDVINYIRTLAIVQE